MERKWQNIRTEPQYVIEDICWWIYSSARIPEGDKYYIKSGPYLDEPTKQLIDLCEWRWTKEKVPDGGPNKKPS